jgi:arylsulfatase A-like enzyme
VNAHVRRLYAADIHGVDAEVGRLVEALRRRGDPLVVLTADHGESLGEHAFYWDHGDYVYNAGTRVPLAFVLPPSHPLYDAHVAGRCSAWVSLVDLAPTLLELLDLQPPEALRAQLEGRSLVPCFSAELSERAVFLESGRAYFPELVARRQRDDLSGGFRAVIAGGWKLIWTPYLPDGGAFELYDLAVDPDEERDLYRPDHPRVAALRTELDRFLAGDDAATSSPEPSPEDLETLRALGYVE